MDGIKDLEVLCFLGNDFESADDFTSHYEKMLLKYKGDIVILGKMKNVLLHQAAFLMTLWFEEERKIRKSEQKVGVQ